MIDERVRRRRPGLMSTVAVLAVVAAVGAPAAVGAGPVDVDAASADGRAGVPADFVALVDDTGVLTVSVPSAWVDVDTAPGTNDDGSTMPWISASTDYATYRETFDVPGTVFVGVTYTTDLQSWIDRLGQPAACATSAVAPYDDGVFQGLAATYEQCGSARQATFTVVAANIAGDTTRTYVLQLQAAAPADVTFFDPILASFNAVGITSSAGGDVAGADDAGAEAPSAGALPVGTTPLVVVTLPDGTPIVPATAPGAEVVADEETAAASVFTPTNAVAEGALRLTDDTRTITVAVPPDWAQSSTAPAADSAGASLAQIVASPDLAGFPSATFTTPGVRFTARPFVADTAAAVNAAAVGLPCTPGAVQQYADPVFAGHIVQLTDCGGTTSRVYLIEASPTDQSMTASLLVLVTDPDDSDLQTVLSTFNVAPSQESPTSAPTADSTGPTGPTGPTVPATVGVAPTVAPPTAVAPTTTPVGTTVGPSTPATPTTVAGPALPTTVGPAPASTTPTGVFTPPVAYPDDTIGITDDTGLLRLGVPPAWSDQITSPFSSDDGTALAYIAASTDLDVYLHDPAAGPDPFTAPGVVYIGLPFTSDTAGLLAQLTASQACTPGPVQEYADPVFGGHIQELTACGGTQTRQYVIVANPPDDSFTASLTVQITDDPAALNTILSTFNYDVALAPPGGAVPTTIAA